MYVNMSAFVDMIDDLMRLFYLDAPPPYPGFRGCFITNVALDELWQIYAFSTAVEASMYNWLSCMYRQIDVIIAMLALMVISAFRICSSRFSMILFRCWDLILPSDYSWT